MKLTKILMQNLVTMFLILNLGCTKFLGVDAPTDQIMISKVFDTDETAKSAIRGIYATMMFTGFSNGNSGSVTFLAGRSADDFVNESADENYQQFSKNDIQPVNAVLKSGIWQPAYSTIYACNAAIENLTHAPKISATVKDQLIGEAKFLRAFSYFYLCNLFGEVPLILTTDYRVNATVSASSIAQVYEQIISDLKDAGTLLKAEYPSAERIRANKWAAIAMLARVYLYHKDWALAELAATEVIKQDNLYRLSTDLNKVFLKNSEETILQFALPTGSTVNTNEGSKFILTAAPGPTTDVTLSTSLLNSFEPGDLRLSNWVGNFTNEAKSWKYAFKYKVKTGNTNVTEYSMVLRLAEQYLIRAEARIMQTNISNGVNDLNVIRLRSRAAITSGIPNPLPDLLLNLDGKNALQALEKERQTELFSEWGHRWFDLKRTGRADAVLSSLKSPYWQSTDILYPIPASELFNDPNLYQNKGYE